MTVISQLHSLRVLQICVRRRFHVLPCECHCYSRHTIHNVCVCARSCDTRYVIGISMYGENSIGMDTPKVGAVISNVGNMFDGALLIGGAWIKAPCSSISSSALSIGSCFVMDIYPQLCVCVWVWVLLWYSYRREWALDGIGLNKYQRNDDDFHQNDYVFFFSIVQMESRLVRMKLELACDNNDFVNGWYCWKPYIIGMSTSSCGGFDTVQCSLQILYLWFLLFRTFFFFPKRLAIEWNWNQ